MGSHLEVLWAHFSVHTSNFNWFFKILSLMNNGSTLLGWDDSPTNAVWLGYTVEPSPTVTSLLQVYMDCRLWNWNLPDNWK